MRIEELMTASPTTCEPDDTLREAAHKMAGSNCGCLPVTAGDGSQRLVGIITDRDICMAVQLQGRTPEELRMRNAMTKEIRACNPRDHFVEAQAIMQEAHVRRLPVVDESERLLGVISLADLACEAERGREALSAQIGAAQFGLVASRIREPHRVGKRTQVAEPAHVVQSSGERQPQGSGNGGPSQDARCGSDRG